MTFQPDPGVATAPADRAGAEEVVRAIVKTLRIRTLYEPNNPIYREFSESLVERFAAYLRRHKLLRVEIREHELLVDRHPVYRDEGTRESLPFTLHKDGIREITFFEGLQPQEIFGFLETVKLDPMRETGEEDVLSRLWERDFVHIRYLFVDLFLDEETIELPGPTAPRDLGFAPISEEYRVADLDGEREVDGRAVLERGDDAHIVKITPDDFDPTLYFLEREEVRRLRDDLEREKQRDLMADLLVLLPELAMLDAGSADVEPVAVLGELLAYFLADESLSSVVAILDIAAELESAPTLSEAKRARAAAVRASALSAESLERVARMLERDPSDDEAFAAYLGRAARHDFAAVVERLGDLKRLARREEVLAPLVAAAAGQAEVLHRLFRHPEPAVVKNAVFLSGRAANRQSLEALEEPFHSRDPEVRIEAINALKTYRSARAMDLLVEAIEDPDKLVRYYALRNLISFNYRPALPAVAAAIRAREFADKDLTEKKLFFEAYGRFAANEALPFLRGLLGKRSLLRKSDARDLKVCAATALGEIGGEEAREVLNEHLSDRNEEVREACQAALERMGR